MLQGLGYQWSTCAAVFVFIHISGAGCWEFIRGLKANHSQETRTVCIYVFL